jgi:membrane protease YdiL (CAAX protease family)
MRDRSALGKLIGAYFALAFVGCAVPLALGHDPLRHPEPYRAWGLSGDLDDRTVAIALSIVAGLLVGVATIASSRVLLRRSRSARALAGVLASPIEGASSGVLVLLALASGVAEELFFRALLVPHTGIVASSVVFGLLHQVRGPGRWLWASWAAVMGAIFALLFVATGELVGAVVAHVLINAQNLHYLRDGRHRVADGGQARLLADDPHQAQPMRTRRTPTPLGGLLARAPRSRMG